MKKKFISILSIVILTSIFLIGCENNNSENQENIDSSTSNNSSSEISQSSSSSVDIAIKDSTNLTEEELNELFVKYITSLNNKVDIEIGDYKNLKLDLQKTEVTNEMVEEELSYIFDNYILYEPIFEGTTKEGDTICIFFEGFLNGEKKEEMGCEDIGYIVEVGDNSFIDDFNVALYDMTPGETKEVVATFPEDYGVEELNGKDGTFKITLAFICGEEGKTTSNKVDLIEHYTRFKNEEELKNYLKNLLQEEIDYDWETNYETYKQSKIMDIIIAETKVKSLKKSAVYEFYQEMIDYYNDYASYYGYTLETFLSTMYQQELDDFLSQYVDQAYLTILYEEILLEIAKKESIEISEEELNDYMYKIVEEYGYSSIDELISDATFDDMKGEEVLRLNALKEKILDFLNEIN